MKTSPPALGMILKGFPRISETFISNEILQLEQLGFRIHIFSMRRPRERFTHESVKRIQAGVDYLPEKILPHLAMLLAHNAHAALHRPGPYRRAAATAIRRFRRTRKSATIKHLLQAGYLVDRLLPGTGVHHLHAHFAHSPSSVALFASQIADLPFSFTAHAKDIYTSDPRQLREKIQIAGFVVTCTEYNRRHLLSITDGTAATPVYRIYHGIDTRLFGRELTARAHPAPPFRILTVARLTEKKGLPTVLRALDALARQGVDFQYTLIGDGDDRAEILQLIRTLGLTERVQWLGVLPHEQVLQHYGDADVFVLGCRQAANGDRDGIPNVLLESMAMGVPVVATRISGIPELVEDDRTGLLVSPNQPDALAQAVLRVLQDGELRARIVQNGRQQVMDDFDNIDWTRRLADVYRREGVASIPFSTSGAASPDLSNPRKG